MRKGTTVAGDPFGLRMGLRVARAGVTDLGAAACMVTPVTAVTYLREWGSGGALGKVSGPCILEPCPLVSLV